MDILKPIFKWFVEKVWPLIQKLIIAAIVDLVYWIYIEVKNLIKMRFTRQEDFAKSRAEDEIINAKNAKTEDEARNHYRMAEMWRQVSDNYREENERLKNDLDKLMREAISKAQSNVLKLKVDDVFDLRDENTLYLKDGVKIMPLLNDHNS